MIFCVAILKTHPVVQGTSFHPIHHLHRKPTLSCTAVNCQEITLNNRLQERDAAIEAPDFITILFFLQYLHLFLRGLM